MDELDFTAKPAKSAAFDPAVARMCFESLGKVEIIPQGGTFFTENQDNNKMYFLVEGDVALTRGGKPLDVVRSGEIFGEMAAISQLPRSATASARSVCRALSLDPKQFQSAIQRTPEFALVLMSIIMNRLRLTIAMLAMSRNLADMEALRERRVFDEKLLADLHARLQHRTPAHAPLNKVIMNEGETGVFMYVVLAGKVAISIKSKTIERVGAGGIFGEMALVDQSPRAATATAETDCNLLSLNRNDFLALVKSNPLFGAAVLKSAADRLRDMTSRRA